MDQLLIFYSDCYQKVLVNIFPTLHPTSNLKSVDNIGPKVVEASYSNLFQLCFLTIINNIISILTLASNNTFYKQIFLLSQVEKENL